MKKIVSVVMVTLLLSANSFADDMSGKELFVKKCAACYYLKFPEKYGRYGSSYSAGCYVSYAPKV